MRDDRHLIAFLREVIKTPINFMFAILDVAGVGSVFLWVADDWIEVAVLLIFVIVLHAGSFLIFVRQRIDNLDLLDQLQDVRANSPILFLSVDGIGDDVFPTIIVEEMPSEPDYAMKIEEEGIHLEEAFSRSLSAKGGSRKGIVESLRQMSMRSMKEKADYNEECAQYISDYERFLCLEYMHKLWKARIRAVNFKLSNSGKKPAEEIHISLEFPEEFDFFPDNLDLAQAEEPPTRPDRPDPTRPSGFSFSDVYRGFQVPLGPTPFESRASDLLKNNISGPLISHGEGTKVSFEIEKLNHGFNAVLEGVVFLISDEMIGETWDVPYLIHSASLPDPIRGKVGIRIESSDAESN